MRVKILFFFIFAFAVIILPYNSVQVMAFQKSERNSPRIKFSCSPEKLFSGGALTLNMPAPHGGDLAIVDPEGKFFFVVYEPDSSGHSLMRQPFMNWEEFKSLRRLNLSTDLSATLMAKDGNGNQRVFTKTGWYKLLLSENLETEIEAPVPQCKVYYSNQR
jgi:hypothetical protein